MVHTGDDPQKAEVRAVERPEPSSTSSAAGCNPIVFFDGVCNLCNAAVMFIIRRDPSGIIRFSPLPSTPGKDEEGPASVLCWANGRMYEKSDAILRIARYLDAPWPLLSAFGWLPRGLRDGVYDFIARHRYHWFGRRQKCMVPNNDLQSRFVEGLPREFGNRP